MRISIRIYRHQNLDILSQELFRYSALRGSPSSAWSHTLVSLSLLAPNVRILSPTAINVSHSSPSETFIIVLLLINLLTVILLPVMSVFLIPLPRTTKPTVATGYCYGLDHGWMP